MVTGPHTITPAASQQLSPMVTAPVYSRLVMTPVFGLRKELRSCQQRGWMAVMMDTFGPMNTFSPIFTGPSSSTVKFTLA